MEFYKKHPGNTINYNQHPQRRDPREFRSPARLAGTEAEAAPPFPSAADSKLWICRMSQHLELPPARIINIERKSATGRHREEGEKFTAAANTVDEHRKQSPAPLPTTATQTSTFHSA